MAAASGPTVGAKVSNMNQGWASIFNTRFDDGYIADIKKYGIGSLYFDGLQMAQRTMTIPTRTPSWFEQLEWEKTVKINSAISTGSAGASISVVVHTDDRDASGNVPIQVGDGIVIPSDYQSEGEDRIYVISAYDSGTYTATCLPLSADGNTITESQIGTEVPTATTLKIHSQYSGYGTGQPTGDYVTRATKSAKAQIIKTSFGVEGGLGAIKWREVTMTDGTIGLWAEGQEKTEYMHNKKLDDAIILGEINDNASLTAVSQFGGTNAIPSTEGVWNNAIRYGTELYYPTTWTQTNFYDVKDLASAQNIVNREFSFLVGTDLLRAIEEGNLEFIREYSGGSDLFQASDKVGIDVKYVNLNGCVFRIQEMKSWANPLRYATTTSDFPSRGLLIPEEMGAATVNGEQEQVPNVMIGYVNNNGEDRSRVMDVVNGMSGRGKALNQYDGDDLYILSEMATLVFRANQLIPVLSA